MSQGFSDPVFPILFVVKNFSPNYCPFIHRKIRKKCHDTHSDVSVNHRLSLRDDTIPKRLTNRKARGSAKAGFRQQG